MTPWLGLDALTASPPLLVGSRLFPRGHDHHHHPALFMEGRHEWRGGVQIPLILAPPVFKDFSDHVSIMKYTCTSSRLLRIWAGAECQLGISWEMQRGLLVVPLIEFRVMGGQCYVLTRVTG